MRPDYDGVIFSGSAFGGKYPGDTYYYRGIGPYRLRTLAANAGYRIKIIDFTENFSKEQLLKLIHRYVQPGCLFYGISTTFMHPLNFAMLMDDDLISTARKLARTKMRVLSGGANASRYIHPKINWYLRGYADLAFPALLDFFSGRSTKIKNRRYADGHLVDGDNDYPFKDTSDLSTEWLPEDGVQPYESLPIEIARGCIFRCSFCSYPLNGKKKFDYIRSSENLRAELERNYQNFGTRSYGFMDDTYNDSEFKMNLMHKALSELPFKIKFSAYIKPELLATWPHHVDLLVESGLQGSSHGIESFNPKARAAIRKGPALEGMLQNISRLANASEPVGTHASFIIGLPYESQESCLQTYDWLKQNTDVINYPSFFPLDIMKPGELAYVSEIEKDPAKYGYRIKPGLTQYGRQFWENDYFNLQTAEIMAKKFQDEWPSFRLSGWGVMMARNLGCFDVDRILKTQRNGLDIDWKLAAPARADFMSRYFNLQMSGSSYSYVEPAVTPAENSI